MKPQVTLSDMVKEYTELDRDNKVLDKMHEQYEARYKQTKDYRIMDAMDEMQASKRNNINRQNYLFDNKIEYMTAKYACEGKR